MNKNMKKVVVSLLSVLMVLSFMPAMAFAADATPVVKGGHSWERTTWVEADAEGLVVIVEPTCTDDGIGQIPCTTELNGTPCGAMKTVWIDRLGHSPHNEMNKIRVTAEQMMDKFGYTDAMKDAFYASEDEFCEANIYECSRCGAYLTASGKEITSMFDSDFADRYKTGHTNPADIKKCAASFKCTVCGIEGRTNDDYNARTSALEHAKEENLDHFIKKYHMKDTTGDGEADQYVKVEYDVCKICKAELNKDISPVGAAMPAFAHTAGAWEVETEPTCTTPGLKVKHCTVCGGLTGDQDEIDPLGHNYKPFIYPEDDGFLYSVMICDRCLDVDESTIKVVGIAEKPVEEEYKYKFKSVVDANCEQGSWIAMDIILGGLIVDTVYYDDLDIEDAIDDGDIVDMNGKWIDKETKEEVPYVRAVGHEFGAVQQVAEATCTDRAIEAKVCSKCNKVDHNTVKTVGKALGHDPEVTVVKAKCGSKGYTSSVCKRCGEDLDKNGTTTGALIWDEVPPVVGYGVECQYEWTVLTPATATTEGTQALVCKVCGDIKPGSETVIPIDADAAKEKEIEESAKPAVEAASAIIADAKNYTDASIKAINDAQTALNQAIASGSAADVKKAANALQAAVNTAEKKAESTLTAKGKTVKAKSKKKTTFTAKKAFNVKNAAGKVTYKKTKGNSKVKVASNGKVTVKKGLKKGKYVVKVTVTDAGNGTDRKSVV